MTAAEALSAVAETLRAARTRRGKRQIDIAAELGCTQATVADWETGRALPRTAEIRKVARVYGVRPTQLLPAEAAA